MGTEILKEQYGNFINEQKSSGKLEKLSKQSNDFYSSKMLPKDSEKLNLDDNSDLELDLKNDNDLNLIRHRFDAFDRPDSSSSSDGHHENKKPPRALHPSKKQNILVKKDHNRVVDGAKKEFENMNSIRESLSFADKLREMNDENGRLRKVLAERDYEIGSLKKRLDEERQVLGSFSSDAAATKIVDLAKRVRELNALLESEKTKTKQLDKSLKDAALKHESITEQNQKLKHKLSTLSAAKQFNYELENEDEDDDEGEKQEKKVSLSKENKELKEKLNQTSHKMMEYKSQCEILKQDLNKYKRALEKELGDVNVDVKSILSSQSNWKGRQQTIRNLQSKLAELKQQQQVFMMDARSSQMIAAAADNFDEHDDEFDENFIMNSSSAMNVGGAFGAKSANAAQMSIYSGMSTASSARTFALDNRHKNDLRRIEKERKENYEKLKREFEQLEASHNSNKEKFDALKARNTVLANENKTLKEQVRTLLEKGKHDDELIEALMKKQNQLREILENLNLQNEKACKEVEEKTQEVKIKEMQEKNTIEQLKNIISERDKRIKQLENDLEQQQQLSLTSTKSSSDAKFFLKSPAQNENVIDEQNSTETLNNKQIESEFMKEYTDSKISNATNMNRKNSAKNFRSDLSSSSSPTKINQPKRPASSSSGSLSTVLSATRAIEHKKELAVDTRKENCELRTLYKTSEVERLRLLDLVKTLQKRVEELNEKALENENRTNEQRRRCATLEKQLEKLKLNESRIGNVAKSKSNLSSANNSTNYNSANNNQTNMDQYKIEELETSLLIQKDENDALKAALKSTLEAKEEDLRLYCEMLDSTKQVFLDGLKQYKQLSSANT